MADDPKPGLVQRYPILHILFVVAAALVMGLPAVRGGFVGGDDHRLALDHVFVNHPSIEHAIKLFTIPHRDLYQPLPLLTFQLEFAMADALGLSKSGEAGIAHLIHLDNLLLHAINAVLVWFLITRLQERVGRTECREGLTSEDRARSEGGGEWQGAGDGRKGASTGVYLVATLAALLFAVHPFQTEVVAWLNGRMMLLSTLFALASMLALISWLDRPRPTTLVLTMLFVLLCGVSKVRISLPVLLLLVAWLRRRHVSRRFLVLWAACGAIMALFVLINVYSTAEAQLFSQGAEHLRGPRPVRVLMALAFYFRHFAWPVGLCSYYPTPPDVSWSDPGLGLTVFVVALGLGLLGLASWKSRLGLFAAIWFFAALAVTLPVFPARNILAADRYMYLPIIGPVWLVAAAVASIHQRLALHRSRFVPFLGTTVPAVALMAAMIGMDWHVASFYNDPISKTARIAHLFPDAPRVWEPLGWSYLDVGRYEEAIDCAKRELRHVDAPKVLCGGYQLWGMAELRRGNVELGLRLLHRAIETDPKNPRAKYRLAKAYDELGRVKEAIPYYEAAAALTPQHNPTLNRLASAYRRVGLKDKAREVFEQCVKNSKGYDVKAILNLAGLDLESGSADRYLDAEKRLRGLLAWMPENADARTNLGVVLGLQGKTREAIEAYEQVLRAAPNHLTALINLAQLYMTSGRAKEGVRLFQRAVGTHSLPVSQAEVVQGFLMEVGEARLAWSLWKDVVGRFPNSGRARLFLTWTSALNGDTSLAQGWTSSKQSGGAPPLVSAALVYGDMSTGQYQRAMQRLERLRDHQQVGRDARSRLLRALPLLDRQRPGVPWIFCVAAELSIMDQRWDAGRLSTKLCEERCDDEPCRMEVARLREALSASGSQQSDIVKRPK